MSAGQLHQSTGRTPLAACTRSKWWRPCASLRWFRTIAALRSDAGKVPAVGVRPSGSGLRQSRDCLNGPKTEEAPVADGMAVVCHRSAPSLVTCRCGGCHCRVRLGRWARSQDGRSARPPSPGSSTKPRANHQRQQLDRRIAAMGWCSRYRSAQECSRYRSARWR